MSVIQSEEACFSFFPFFKGNSAATWLDGDSNVFNWLSSALIKLHSDISHIDVTFVMNLAAAVLFLWLFLRVLKKINNLNILKRRLFNAKTHIFGWYYPQPVQETVKQTEHLENYNRSVFCFCSVFSCAVRAHPGGFIFFIYPTANHKLPYTRPPLACQSPPWGNRLERDKRGREQAKAREDETGGGDRWESG